MVIRVSDIVCRYGGEEFIVYVPGLCSKTLSLIKVEEIRRVIESTVVVVGKVEIKFTTSIGIIVTSKGICDIQDVIKIADNNLFENKNSGRNKSMG